MLFNSITDDITTGVLFEAITAESLRKDDALIRAILDDSVVEEISH